MNKKLMSLILTGVLSISILTGCSSTEPVEEPKQTTKYKLEDFELDSGRYIIFIDAPLEDNYHELTVLSKYTGEILNVVEQFKNMEGKQDYSGLTISFMCAKGELVDADGNKNESPMPYGNMRFTKEQIEDIDIHYYKENPLKLFDNYEYTTIPALKK